MESVIERQPKIAMEWNYDRNRGLNPKLISSQSKKEVWWKCKRGHEWKAMVRARVNLKAGCPECR